MNVKKISLALLLVALFAIMLVCTVGAASPEITVSNKTVTAGDTVSVDIYLENNPGLIVMRAFVEYNDKYITLTKVTDGGILGDKAHSPDYDESPQTLYWSNPLLKEDITEDGKIATLTFKVAKNTPAGKYDIDIYFQKTDVINAELKSIGNQFDFTSGTLTVKKSTSSSDDEEEEDEEDNENKDSAIIVDFDKNKIMAGEKVKVTLWLENNPGIIALRTLLDYDDRYFEITDVDDHELIGECLSTKSSAGDEAPFVIYCSSPLSKTDIDDDGELVTVTFKAKTTTPAGTYTFSLSGDDTDIINTDLDALGDEFEFGKKKLTVTKYVDEEDDDEDDDDIDDEDDEDNEDDEDDAENKKYYAVTYQNDKIVITMYNPCISYGDGVLINLDDDILEQAITEGKKKYSDKSAKSIELTVHALEVPDNTEEMIVNITPDFMENLASKDTMELSIASARIKYDGAAIKDIKTATAPIQVLFRNRKLSKDVTDKFTNGYTFFDIEMSHKLESGEITIDLPDPYYLGNATKNIVVYALNGNKLDHIGSDISYGNKRISFVDSQVRPYLVTIEKLGFKDIENHWAKDSINFVASRGIFNGKSDTEFAPDDVLSRGMLVTVMGRLDGIDISGYNCMFDDVDKNQYYAPYIEWARRNNIVGGVGDNKFEPDRGVNRQEIAVIVTRYLEYKGKTLTSTAKKYADSAKIDSWASEAVNKVSNAGIITGSGDDFLPKNEATRAQTAAILQRIIKFLG